MDKKTFYITTPIYYPSDKLHIGHGYTTVAADTISRYKRMRGYDVMFLTGTDEHGQKIAETAKAKGKDPQSYVDEIVLGIKELWKLLNISNDRFIRTTDAYHKSAVQKIFKALYEKGDIYKSHYKGNYCTPCESFWTPGQLVDGKCPDCSREVKEAEEEAYFFRLSAYADKILKLYEENPTFLQPKSRVNEMVNNFIKPGLEDLCVSRTSFTWGVPVDFDPGHVVYVWVDALSNYITALGYENDEYNDYDKYWPADVHLMAKEIIRFHSIIWPAMLMALDLPLPKKVFGHGWLLLEGGKMSKSKGNVVDPVLLCERYGVDAIRYFLLREIPFGQDGIFSNEALINRINADLANDLGNLLSRTVAMTEKYFGGTLPEAKQAEEIDEELISMAQSTVKTAEALMEDMLFPNALTEVFKLISRANKYIDETAPWVLGKDMANSARLSTVLYNLLETLRISAVLLSPAMPDSTAKILEQICASAELSTWESIQDFGGLSKTTNVIKGAPLFPRIDVKKELEELEALTKEKQAPEKAEKSKEKPEGVAELADINDFKKIQLIVAKIKQCTEAPKSDKLLILTLDDGLGERQVVSGIREWYSPESLIGKNIIVIANLKPAKIRGIESNGMILAADDGDNVRVIFPGDDITPGSKVR